MGRRVSRGPDILVIGAGMAGASLAAEIAGAAGSVTLIEAEAQAGYHATGRSAAFWSETYGGPLVQPLTSASGAYLRGGGFLRPRGGLHLAAADDAAMLDAMAAEFAGTVELRPVPAERLPLLLPGLRAGWRHALLEPGCADIEVAALHASYLKAARAAGARLVLSAEAVAIERRGGRWAVATRAGGLEADIVVNAAGAWADAVAAAAGALPLGIRPYRRTVAQLRVAPPAPADLPLVVDAAGRFYFKPEAGGRIWLSPHDETPSAPCDCAADEYDVALAVDRLEAVVDWAVERVERRWAGLRSFAPDRAPVYGYDPACDGFFWFAGQGGFGIQTAPAAAKLAASLLLGTPADAMVAAIDPAPYRPGRFR